MADQVQVAVDDGIDAELVNGSGDVQPQHERARGFV